MYYLQFHKHNSYQSKRYDGFYEQNFNPVSLVSEQNLALINWKCMCQSLASENEFSITVSNQHLI